MKKNFNEKQQRFSFRKLSVGLVSATVASLFFMTSIATAQGVGAQSIQLTYVTEQELTDQEKNAIVYDVPGKVDKTDATYYLVYRPVQMMRIQFLILPIAYQEQVLIFHKVQTQAKEQPLPT
ncbi:TPA: YSIRK-type signal peptide-containing protein [Streptococcus suis]|nr:YSIRK-type signal peptide-containing protein [Streptococcus suis]HEM6007383.1 YSIRK-type signal peptide-containing protein [Streptococcus suis]HEM6013936.1 YSIRK-type signal peptide-containing protein [Streptococcus suis]HEM6029618.1 YSIRK-type signal peptide-containing protein [Streptococcus suis]HEM6352138.1 YSIRK-type signal peptide-containing protein [Streptococcus suis]